METAPSRESTGDMQGTVTSQLRAADPARLQEGSGEETLKPWTMNKRQSPTLRPRRRTADPPKEDVPLSPLLCLVIQATEAGAG